ncbi:MAG TPA: hypothetical protein VGS80_13935, partial [Ktedonobacterales bacterium]|nr:hypothetical protein [Ktedonobacterales bacterium]
GSASEGNMWTAFLIGLVILIIAGASVGLAISVRGKLRPGFGRSWRIQSAVFAVGQYFMALALLSLSLIVDKNHPFGLSRSQPFTSTGIGIATSLLCCMFVFYQRTRLSAPAFRYGDVSRVARKDHDRTDS